MKKRFKAILGRVAALVSALPFVISSLSLSVSADTYYTRLSWSTFSSLIGSTVQGYYLADGGVLKPITLSLHDNNTQYITSVSMDNTLAPNATTLAPNSYICWYKCSIPSDLYLSSESYLPYFQIDWNVHFTNVTYFGCDTFCYNQRVYTTLNRQYLAQYNTFIAGSDNSSVHTVPFASGSDTLAGRTYVVNKSEAGQDYFGGIWAFYEGTATDYYIGSATYSNVFYNKYGDYIYFGLSCPVLNPEWSFVDNSAPPAPGGGGGDDGGGGSATGSASGTYGDGDINLDLDISVPDYSSRLDAIEDAINPSLDSSQSDIYNKFDSEGEEYHNLENSLLDNMASQIDNMDSIVFEFDPTYVEEAEDFTPLFNYPLVMWMTNLVLIISLISFLIFGKWV